MNSENRVLGRSLLPVNHDAKIKDTIAKEIPVLWLNIVSYKYHLVNRTVFTQSELRSSRLHCHNPDSLVQKFQVHMLSILPAAHPPRARNVRCTAPACQLTTEREEEEEGASCVEFSKRAESPHSSPPPPPGRWLGWGWRRG